MNNLKQQVFDYIDSLSAELFSLGEKLFNSPELGFKEQQTRSIMLEKIQQLEQVSLRDNLAITGFSTTRINPHAKRTIALLAEMDAVFQPQHFCAAKDGASHCCGHDSQMVIMYAAFKTLLHLGLDLPVNLRLMFTPAEEFLDLDYRLELRQNGAIQALSGKQELLARGEFKDVDLVIASHSLGGNPDLDFDLGTNLAGFIIKRAKFIGKAAHAGAAPESGINALNAANLAMSAIAYQRETFADSEHIRVSPVLKSANWSANVIPAEAELEMYIRAASVEAIEQTATKVDACLQGAAHAIGCKLEINNLMGYLPLRQHPRLTQISLANAQQLVPATRILNDGGLVAASGDIGDLSLLMPTIQIGYGGYQGAIHGVDFKVARPEQLYLTSAKLVVATVLDLIANDAELTTQICEEFVAMSPTEYLDLIARLSHAS